MSEAADLITRYNYDEFVPEKFRSWIRFAQSSSVGEKVPDFSAFTEFEKAFN